MESQFSAKEELHNSLESAGTKKLLLTCRFCPNILFQIKCGWDLACSNS
jgi:hypothetical protein